MYKFPCIIPRGWLVGQVCGASSPAVVNWYNGNGCVALEGDTSVQLQSCSTGNVVSYQYSQSTSCTGEYTVGSSTSSCTLTGVSVGDYTVEVTASVLCTSAPPSSNSNGVSTAVIIGATVGSVAGIGIIVGFVLFVKASLIPSPPLLTPSTGPSSNSAFASQNSI